MVKKSAGKGRFGAIGVRSFYGPASAAIGKALSGYKRKRAPVKKTSTRKKFKAGFGKTVTRRSSSKQSFEADDLHSGKTMSTHHIYLGKKHKVVSKSQQYGHFEYHQENSETISCAAGSQTIAAISGDLYVNQLDLRTFSDVDPAPDFYYNGLMKMNPNKRASGDGLPGGSGVAAGVELKTTRLYVDKIVYNFQVVNASNTPTDFNFYATVRKKASFISTGAAWNQLVNGPIRDMDLILSNMPGSATSVAASDASGVQTAAVFGKPTKFNYGFTPFQLEAFRKLYGLKMKRTVLLAPGAYHRFNIVIHVNRSFSEESLEVLRTRGVLDIAGLTLDMWGIVRGSPVIVRDATGVPYTINKSVTSSAAQIGWMSSRKVNGHFFDGAMSTQIDYSMPTWRLIGGTTTGKLINIVDAEVDNDIVS